VESSDSRPGGASNVYENMTALGLNVVFVHTSTPSQKRRVWVGDRLVCRYDLDGEPSKSKIPFPDPRKFDAVVFSDYQKGILRHEINMLVAPDFLGFEDHPPVFVDTKSPCPEKIYAEADFVFPNSEESYRFHGEHRRFFKNIIQKAGDNGCFVNGEHVPTEAIRGADTVGAGDVFLAGFVWAYLTSPASHPNARILYAAEMANKAAGISCTRRGTAIVSLKDMEVCA
jgi:bifunctional ADP-heptose synthase (sugar kinase/adenylyltransferase)